VCGSREALDVVPLTKDAAPMSIPMDACSGTLGVDDTDVFVFSGTFRSTRVAKPRFCTVPGACSSAIETPPIHAVDESDLFTSWAVPSPRILRTPKHR
jgi:hypothetical protein